MFKRHDCRAILSSRCLAYGLIASCGLVWAGNSGGAFAQGPGQDAPDEWPVVYVRVDRPSSFETLFEKAPLGGEPAEEALAGAVLHRTAAGIPDDALDRILMRTKQATGRTVFDPRTEAQVRLDAGTNLDEAIEYLKTRPGVLTAMPAPRPVTPPGGPPNYQPFQSYQNTGGGVGAEEAWSALGLSGAGIAMCDVEYDFNEDHCDLPDISVLGFNPVSPFGDDHGTAVFGEMVSLDNGTGTKGTAFGATDLYFSPTYNGSVYDVASAIYRAITALPEGSVLVLEVQTSGPNYENDGTQNGLVPNEWWQPDYNAIVSAVANGIIVVAAAGNGNEDLDDPIYSTGNSGHWPFLPANDSGAIIVGAGGAPASCAGNTFRGRMWFSNYGQRVNVQGHGECVRTTGYGSIFSENNCDYTATFSGTSSATPIVAGACMLIQEAALAGLGRPLTSWEMRDALMASGQAQAGDTSEHIGPLPDIIEAIDTLDIAPPCVADFDGDGAVTGSDLSYVLGSWGQPGITDIDGSGTTDGVDLSYVLGSWGACPQ